MPKRVFLIVFIALTASQLSSATQKPDIESLEWIAGCWASDDGKQRIEEHWMRPAGQTMMGMSRTVAGGKTVFTEYTQIREVDGQLAYVVSLGLAAKPVIFKLVKNSNGEATFENPEHDFPQRIIYRRESSDALFARIEGKEKGVNKAIDFRYKRSRCD
jgi:Domain of unknown function (DUF6265)